MRLIIEPNYDLMSKWAAYYVASCINSAHPTPEHPFVLGLPTGSSPVGMYRYLVQLHKDGLLSFRNVVTFNMDEYCGIPHDHEQSYHSYMDRHFFDHIDIPRDNINILNGNAPDLLAECAAYEAKIKSYGGVDLFLGGVGPDGHLAFNEPGSAITSRTRIKTLTTDTRRANSRFFGGDMDAVPATALTVGVGTVLDAKKVLVLISGPEKARALQHGVEEGITCMWTISALQLHPNALIVTDEAACEELKVSTYKYFKDIESKNITPDLRFD